MPADPSRAAWRRILPILLVAAVTLAAFAAISEGAARLLFRQSQSSVMSCLIATDARTGVRGLPGSSCQQQAFETPLIDYRFNACGFRTPQPCGAAPGGTYRIVLVGSSLAYGMHVQQPETFAARIGPMLSARLGRPVDVFNESMQWAFPSSVALRTEAMLAPHPDMILWTLTPFDIENVRLILPFIPGVQEGISVPAPQGEAASAPPPAKGLATLPGRAWRRLTGDIATSRTVFLLQHTLYRSQSQFLSHALGQSHDVDYLRVPTPPEFQDNLAVFAQAIDRVTQRARAAGVPLVVTLLPSRPQAIMLANHQWDAGFDPNALGRALRPIVEAKGGHWVDMTAGLTALPDAGQPYLPVDEHPTPAGHAMLANLLTDALIRSGTLPAAGGAKPR